MSTAVDVVLFVEHVARELDVACAVKTLAAQRGLTVAVASMPYHLAETLEAFRPHLVALPYARFFDRPGPLRHIRRSWPDAQLVDLAWEQFMTPQNLAYRAPRDAIVREQIVHHAWGEFYADYLRANGVNPANIVVNGNPTYALYQEPYRRLYPRRADLAEWYELDLDRPWAFFPENFVWAFLGDADIQLRLRNGYDPVSARANCESSRRSLAAVLRWIAESEGRTQAQIILRPRPAVPRQMWIDAFEEHVGWVPRHVRIVKEGTVREWTLESDWTLSSISTVMLEAAMAGKPAYAFWPEAPPEGHRTEWQDLLPHITSTDSLLAVLNGPRDGDSAAVADYVRQRAMTVADPIAGLVDLLQRQRAAVPEPSRQIPHRLERFTEAVGARVRSFLDERTTPKLEGNGQALNTFEMDHFTQERVDRTCGIIADFLA